jgi:tetratricopeptide (TPR) repeat protein
MLKSAMEKYIVVLESDESNVFAALGIANVLAEHNKVPEAIEILKGVKEASPSHITLPNVIINLAHLNIVQENYESAINLYKIALEKYPQNKGDLECELYLAKAFFLSKQFEKCSTALRGLVSRYPQDLRIRFDLANCLYEEAKATFNKEFRQVKETKEAIENLHHSQKLMDFLLSLNDSSLFLPQSASPELKDLAGN